MLPVHYRAKNLPRKRLEFSVGTVLERHLFHVAPNVEGGIVFPPGKAEVKGRGNDPLQVAGKQRQLGFDKPHAVFERDLALKHANGGYVEGHALAFEMEEYGVTPRKAVVVFGNV